MSRSRSNHNATLLVWVLTLLVLAVVCRADDLSPDDSFMREILAGLEDEDAALDGLDELLREAAAFRENPIDVNAASVSALLRVPFMDPAAAVRVVASLRTAGPVSSLYELVERGCLSGESLPVVRPYLVARLPGAAMSPPEQGPSPVPALSSVALTSSVRWELRLRATAREHWESAWGEREAWNGSGTFARLRVSYAQSVDVSVACEKDAGERSMADHSAVSVVWRNAGGTDAGDPALAVGAGDFTGSWGQGLVFRSGGFPSESGYPRRRDKLGRYDGAGEANARRGVFVTAERGAARVHALLARSALDAAVSEDGTVTSIRTTGYHRTEGERDGAATLDESLAGARVTFETPVGLELSASVLRLGYSIPLASGDPVRQRFRFSGDELTAGGFDVRASAGDLKAGCEIAVTTEGGVAALAAARLARGSSRVGAGAAYLSRDYWSPLGGGVPGFSGGSNGAVAWVSAEYRLGTDWKVWASTRGARRPWRSYYSELPDGSSSVTTGGEFKTRRGWRIALESRVRSRSGSGGDPIGTVDGTVRRVRATLRTAGSVPLVVAASRIASCSGGFEEGVLLAVALRVSGSVAGTGSYAAGLTSVASRGDAPPFVQYEPRLPGEFGLASLNAEGTRWYIRIQVGLSEGWGLSARLSGGPERGQTQFGLGVDARG